MNKEHQNILPSYYLASNPKFHSEDIQEIWNTNKSFDMIRVELKHLDSRKDISSHHYEVKAYIPLKDILYDIWKTVDCPYKIRYYVNPNDPYNSDFEMVPITKYIYYVLAEFLGTGLVIFERRPEKLEWIISTYGSYLHISHSVNVRNIPHGALNKRNKDYWECKKCGNTRKRIFPREIDISPDEKFSYIREIISNDNVLVSIKCLVCNHEWFCKDFELNSHCFLDFPQDILRAGGRSKEYNPKSFDSRSVW